MARRVVRSHWELAGRDIRLKVEHPDYDFLSIKVLYTLGGFDGVRCDHDNRGYYLSVIPVGNFRPNVKDGAKLPLLAVNRRSDKKDALANGLATVRLPIVVADVCDKIGAGYSVSDLNAALGGD